MRRLLTALAARRVIDAGPERRATWLELFFDLVFAAAVAEVAGLMVEHFSWSGLAGFLPPFLLIWWAWMGHTFFSTRFDSDDVVQRLLTVGQMFLVAVMAANAQPDIMAREAAGLAAAYGGMRVLLALQYLRCIRVDPTGRVAGRYAAGVGLAAGLWIMTSVVPAEARVWIALPAIVIDLLSPVWASGARLLPPHRSHLPERLGLFTLVVLGEMVAGTMAGMRHQEHWSAAAAGAAVLGLALAFGLWWFYFDVLRVPEPRAEVRGAGRLGLVAHLPLCLGIVVAGAGLEHIVAIGGVEPLGADAARLLATGLLLVLAAKAAIAADLGSVAGTPARTRLLGLALLTLAVLAVAAPLVNGFGSVWLLALLLAGLLATMWTIARALRPGPAELDLAA